MLLLTTVTACTGILYLACPKLLRLVITTTAKAKGLTTEAACPVHLTLCSA